MEVSELDALKQRLSALREQERAYIRENDDVLGEISVFQIEVDAAKRKLAEANRKLAEAVARHDRLDGQLEDMEAKIEKLESRIETRELEEAAARKRIRNEEEATAPYVAPPPDPEEIADRQWMREKGLTTHAAIVERTKMLQDVVADLDKRDQRPGSRRTEKFIRDYMEARDELARLLRIQDRRKKRILGINRRITQEARVMSKLERFYVYLRMRFRRCGATSEAAAAASFRGCFSATTSFCCCCCGRTPKCSSTCSCVHPSCFK